MLVENYHDLVWQIATGISGSCVFFVSISLVFDYIRTMLFNNK